MDLFNLKPILEMSRQPQDKDAFNEWIEQKESLNFLLREAVDDYVIVYASLPNFYLHAIFVKSFDHDSVETSELDSFQVEVDSTWGIVMSGDDIFIEAPLADSQTELIGGAERILFRRSFDGVPEIETYFELNQKLVHILNLHFVPERSAWCKLNARGNIDEVAKVIEVEGLEDDHRGTIIAVQRDALGEYAGLEGFCILRNFDFTRFDPTNFIGWNHDSASPKISDNPSVIGRLTVLHGYGSYAHGWQKIDLAKDKGEILDEHWPGRRSESNQYEMFIAQDWKNGAVKEISCNPKCLANFFTESDLPFELSPAFFDPEVLLKYKADRDKYQLTESSVSCRGSWHLKTYGINDAGQVHSYLGCLGRLPHNEQLHWKQFNQKPKAPISDQTYKTDFEGCWDREYDPLSSLKEKLTQLNQDNCEWWKLRDDDLLVRTHYPFTDSKDEWAEELLNLDQLIVEGLVHKSLRKKARELGRDPAIEKLEKKNGSSLSELKLLEQCLIGLGIEEELAGEILSPFHELHNFRSIFKGHANNAKKKQLAEKELLKKHKLHRLHFKELCQTCDESLLAIYQAFQNRHVAS